MNKMLKVDRIFRSSFDELVDSIFQKPTPLDFCNSDLPLANLGDYIELYKEKRTLEAQIERLQSKLDGLTDNLRIIESKEQALRLNERSLSAEKKSLETSCQNKSLFLANMSHEIRTPMNGVIGSLEILKDTDLSANQQKYLGIIETCSHSLLSVINDILDYSKIEANELKIESVDFNLKEIVSQVKDILIFKAQEKGIEFTTHIVHNVPLWLKGDPLRIRQVLLNLASNAVKFTESGTVAIEISLQSENRSRVALTFKVKDTGIGISAKQKELLFQSYSQVASDTARKYGGTGLGLAISKKLTDLMKGKIGVKSKETMGSEFWFSIPLLKQDGTQKHQADLFQAYEKTQKKTHHTRTGVSLLLVEDDLINQKITSILLEKEGFDVTIAESGCQALQKLKSNRFDLILMDVEMPGMNGYETTREIRQLSPEKYNTQIPIIAMTAHAMSGDREKCLNAGMNDYISKPVNMHRLNDLIDQILTRKEGERCWVPDDAAEADHSDAIDMSKLKILRCEVDEKFDFLVDVFSESIPQKMIAIYNAIEEQDYKSLETSVHQLKGSCSAFYAQKMVEICQELEALAVNPDRDLQIIDQQVTLLQIEAERVIDFLHLHL